ncbi:gas vesicle accessory protein GvpU [Alkalicoccus chagannorensis]|uniref:gas vesicle accessory protein GvpU n=1 Tax=Alkalicoccus chagannorensis TaxID=427072 RepID=UPI000407F614|nr:gas vesicle accessory protein GvpU [Alkalicoccus chagannorensis]
MPGIVKEKDVILQLMIDAVNESSDYEIAVTLNTGGLLISGTLAGVSDYFEELKKEFEGGHEQDEHIRSQLDRALERLDAASDSDISYIHLKGARIYDPSGNAVPNTDTVLWRGQLKEVDGFFLGALERT